ncbi:MAG: radical SAM protein [Bacteroidales bacterium]|nr:radical SAM protein [Bacteroidales bacterium]
MICFGPVPSRRLGNSLGINNVFLPKVCSYNCIYCQVGKTITHRIERLVFYKPDFVYKTIIDYLNKLDKNNLPDYLTFVANGEPTLDINIGKIIKLLKNINLPIAVITNASLLYQLDVQNDLLLSDWVSIKIDAGNNVSWKKINHPYKTLNFEIYKNSLFDFSKKYKGVLCTETMLIQGVNDNVSQIDNIASIIAKINPKIAYISIPIRPPAFSNTIPADLKTLNEAWQIFTNKGINTEFLINLEGTNIGYTGDAYEDILNILAVHPLQEDSLLELLKKDNADFSIVQFLLKKELIKSLEYNGKIFYLHNYKKRY